MKNKRRFLIATAVVFFIAFAAFGILRFLPQKVDAFNPQPDPPGYGMVGITEGQTLRISVVNTAPVPTEAGTQPNPSRVVMTFRDANGSQILNANGQPIQRVVFLNAGQAASLNLNVDNLPRINGLRLEIRPDIRIQRPDSNGGVPPDPIIPTAEIINNQNGRTQFMLQHFVPPDPVIPAQ